MEKVPRCEQKIPSWSTPSCSVVRMLVRARVNMAGATFCRSATEMAVCASTFLMGAGSARAAAVAARHARPITVVSRISPPFVAIAAGIVLLRALHVLAFRRVDLDLLADVDERRDLHGDAGFHLRRLEG